MRIYKYWAKHQQTIKGEQRHPQTGKIMDRDDKPYTFIGGSNESVADAELAAREKAKSLEALINGEVNKNYNYEVDIREEIISEIDEHNIITRNRYGALILNAEHTMFVDIDQKDFGFFYRFHTNIITQIKDAFRKPTLDQRILRHIERVSHKAFLKTNYIRVYRTPAGYRLMILGEKFDPRSLRSRDILKSFGSDWLYNKLCHRQNCFRARLTPKPNRIRVKGHRVVFPLRDEEQELVHQNWVKHYHEKAENFAACRYLFDYGSKSYIKSKIVSYHDKVCHAMEDYPIA